MMCFVVVGMSSVGAARRFSALLSFLCIMSCGCITRSNGVVLGGDGEAGG